MPSKYPKKMSEERKLASRNKEKKRNIDINEAFNVLQKTEKKSSFTSVPFITKKKKVPKVKMLRLAIKYIQHLENILNDGYHQPSPYCPPRPLKLEDFEIVAAEEFNERNTYSNRLHEDEEYYTIMKARVTSSMLSSVPSSTSSTSSTSSIPDGHSPSSSSLHAPSITPSLSPNYLLNIKQETHY